MLQEFEEVLDRMWCLNSQLDAVVEFGEEAARRRHGLQRFVGDQVVMMTDRLKWAQEDLARLLLPVDLKLSYSSHPDDGGRK